MQEIVCALIVIAAAAYAGRRWFGRRKASSCGGCAGACSTPQAAVGGKRVIPIRRA